MLETSNPKEDCRIMIKTTAYSNNEKKSSAVFVQSLNEDKRYRTREKRNSKREAEEEKLSDDIAKMNAAEHKGKLNMYYGDEVVGQNDAAVLGWVNQEMCTPSPTRSYFDMINDRTSLDKIHSNNGFAQLNGDTLVQEDDDEDK